MNFYLSSLEAFNNAIDLVEHVIAFLGLVVTI